MAAHDLAGQLAFQGLDFHLYAEVGDHQAGLLRAEIAALELFEHARFPLGCAGGALFLNLLDAPALPAGQLAFGHGGSTWKKPREFSTQPAAAASKLECALRRGDRICRMP
ncbi:hypothetical protein D9M71_164810 [compost metagenome]